jgi:oxygen-independent coproporphyrinogen-3 oxidase
MNINRLSIGVQAWQNDLLKLIGRNYEIETFQQAYQWAREVGFKNINLDLIFALPTQTLTQWQETIEQIIDLKPEHIACYSLELDNHSIFNQLQKNGQLTATTDVLNRQMYHFACRELKKANYEQYEISNFAQKGFACQHNLNFWQNKDYLGLGASAASKIADQSWHNARNIALYCQKLEKGELAIENKETVNLNDEITNFIALALRTNKGIDTKKLKDQLNFDLKEEKKKELQKLVNCQLVKQDKNLISLTTKGKDLLNQVIIELI